MASHIQNVLREAEKNSGIDRESLLLHALKLVFETHAATEDDWKSASGESQARWYRQIKELLNHLEFCTAGAEAYAGQTENLSHIVQTLKHRIAEHQATAEALRVQKTERESELRDTETVCAGLQHDCREIQRHIEALKAESDRYRRETGQGRQMLVTLEAENTRLMQILSDLKKHQSVLSTEIGNLSQDASEHQTLIQDLNTEIARLRNEIDRQNADIQQLTDEFNLLRDLQRVLVEHHQLENILGIDQAHALANYDLINQLQQQHSRLHTLQQQINTYLEEADRLLAAEIGLSQKQWDDLRRQFI